MKVTKEELEEIIWDDDERFEEVEDTIDGTSRWTVWHTKIVYNEMNDKHYQIRYEAPATENQGCVGDYLYDKVYELEEVIKKEVMTYEWVLANPQKPATPAKKNARS